MYRSIASAMASPVRALLLYLLLSMAAATAITSAASGTPKKKISHLHLYTSNVTTYAVAGLNRSAPSIFGDVFVYDTPLTAGPSPSSQVVGRGQGMAVGVSRTDAALLTSINMVFTAGKYNGSSLAMYGGVDGAGVGDRPIVGGSGGFRLARGYALSKTTQMTPYVVVEFNIYVWHY